MSKHKIKTISIAEILMLSGLVAVVWIRDGAVVALGFAVAIVLGRMAAKRYIVKALDRKNRQSPRTQ